MKSDLTVSVNQLKLGVFIDKLNDFNQNRAT